MVVQPYGYARVCEPADWVDSLGWCQTLSSRAGRVFCISTALASSRSNLADMLAIMSATLASGEPSSAAARNLASEALAVSLSFMAIDQPSPTVAFASDARRAARSRQPS